MKTRLAGLGLIRCGILVAVLFVYLPVRDGPGGFTGPVRSNALVFIPLAVLTGLACVVGGPSVLGAFQARPKSKGQLVLVLSLIIGSGVQTGLGYWQLKTRWMRPPEPVILDGSPRTPDLLTDDDMSSPRPARTRWLRPKRTSHHLRRASRIVNLSFSPS